jgi:DNA mismatch endonuclease (patch repair protein)
MSRVKGKDTKPEKLVRSLLHSMGYRFRLHRKDLPGKPDIVLPKHRKVVFVHGCFWHGHDGCPRAARPAANAEFWNRKIDGNIKRDAQKLEELKVAGWQALTIWQCELRNVEALRAKLSKFLKGEEIS